MLDKNLNAEKSVFMSVEEAATLMKSTKKTLYTYLCDSGSKQGKKRPQFPKEIYIKMGRKVLFIREKLLKWLLDGANMV